MAAWEPLAHGHQHRCRGDHRLAGAHVALQQTAHGLLGLDVGQDVVQDAVLGAGELEGQRPTELIEQILVDLKRSAGLAAPPAPLA